MVCSYRETYLWEDDQGSLNETLIALSAAYQALARYIGGADIYLMPRSQQDLLEKLYVPDNTDCMHESCLCHS